MVKSSWRIGHSFCYVRFVHYFVEMVVNDAYFGEGAVTFPLIFLD